MVPDLKEACFDPGLQWLLRGWFILHKTCPRTCPSPCLSPVPPAQHSVIRSLFGRLRYCLLPQCEWLAVLLPPPPPVLGAGVAAHRTTATVAAAAVAATMGGATRHHAGALCTQLGAHGCIELAKACISLPVHPGCNHQGSSRACGHALQLCRSVVAGLVTDARPGFCRCLQSGGAVIAAARARHPTVHSRHPLHVCESSARLCCQAQELPARALGCRSGHLMQRTQTL